MPITVENLDALIAAYNTLGVDVRASAAAIRHRYLELAREHHPDKWPNASLQQQGASARMREINAAYDLIGSAPLRDHTFASDPIPSVDEVRTTDKLSRPVSVFVETMVRFALGAAFGGFMVFRLYDLGVPGTAVFALLLPLFFAFVFTGTSNRASRLIDLWWWWS